MSSTAVTQRAEDADGGDGDIGRRGGRGPRMPEGAREAAWFQLYNALSWQITLGAPAIVYAKSLGASATVLGLMAALTPLLTVFQLPATPLLARYGYKKFLLAGWGSRTVTIFLMAGVPLMGWASDGVKLWTLLGLLTAFNLVRGFASGAWWPWISALVPQELRGRYLSWEQAFIQAGALSAMLVAAAVLGREASPWQYAVLFLISGLAQTASLVYVRKIPEPGIEERRQSAGRRVPWKEIVTWPPFMRLVTFNVAYWAGVGGVNVFTVSYMRGRADFSESTVMFLAGVAVLGALSTVSWVGKLLDHEGSRPVLRGGLLIYIAILGIWWALAAGALPPAVWLVAILQLAVGMAGANIGVANWRLASVTIPVMGRDHFFAVYSVITNLAMGLSPILWGVILDLIGQREWATAWVRWNRYSVFFLATAALVVGALWLVNFLPDSGRRKTEGG